ncbi:hypothetical protein OO015_12500 [Thermomicrobium sp. 4228-Ro]|uniref:hypothetical protein n=1 Tax=Thermomicrobium sp. 4228-Ro TaxID=2993937 RepID=UPI0022488175|nr:hypothetical protein [Thermomicrobium sp. 4228-Ro]MCX2728311.1 hypothetical protein [Thermomicrobium sp. 4228-Ro]
MSTRRGAPRVFAAGVATVLVGFVLGTMTVPWLAPLSRVAANLAVVAGMAIVAAGWALAGVGLVGVGRRWRGALLGLLAYCVAGAIWTAVFVLLDPWAVDYGRIDLARFVVYSVLLWPYALAYAAGWFGLGGL